MPPPEAPPPGDSEAMKEMMKAYFDSLTCIPFSFTRDRLDALKAKAAVSVPGMLLMTSSKLAECVEIFIFRFF